MNYAGCKRKFKVDQFVARYSGSTTAKGITEKRKSSAKAALPTRNVGQRKRILDHIESKEKLTSEVTAEKVVKKQKGGSPASAKKKTVKKKVKVKRKKSPTK